MEVTLSAKIILQKKRSADREDSWEPSPKKKAVPYNMRPDFRLSVQMYKPKCETFKYESLIKVGEGSYGTVFKAHDKTNDKIVALKKMVNDKASEDLSADTVREVMILQQIKHLNVVKFVELSICTSDPHCGVYLVFEYCDHDLANLLTKGKFSAGQKKNIIQQLLLGIEYIHDNRIMHRDLKPDNILVTSRGVVKLADFGMATVNVNEPGQPLEFSSVVVTRWYRPPEVLLGDRKYGPSLDMWSAGCILAEVWTTIPIMAGDTEQEQLFLISDLCGSISPEVWPRVGELSHFGKIQLPTGKQRKLRATLTPYMKDELACDLVDNLLQLDPAKRYDASRALNHSYFRADPMLEDLATTLALCSKLSRKRSASLPTKIEDFVYET